MKIHLLGAAALVALLSSVQAQEATIEHIKLYRDSGGEIVEGSVYLNKVFHINENDSPVHIVSAVVRHVPQETAFLADWILNNWGQVVTWDNVILPSNDISPSEYFGSLRREKLEITINARGENAVAVKFGVIVYDAFKEYLGGLTAISMDMPTAGMQWDFSPPYLFKFKKYGVVGLFVRQVRLRDGRIWNFDENVVAKEFSKRLGKVTREQVSDLEAKAGVSN